MASSRRWQRRCKICRCGFAPHARLGDRQRVCSKPGCQEERRRRNQERWRQAHPGYFIAWRAKERGESNASEPVDLPRVPEPLRRLPWQVAQEEFGVVGTDFLASLGRLLVAKDSIRGQVSETTGEFYQEGSQVAKDSMLGQGPESSGKSGRVEVG